MEHNIVDLIDILKLQCPCSDPECSGVWLTLSEANDIRALLNDLERRRCAEWLEEVAVRANLNQNHPAS